MSTKNVYNLIILDESGSMESIKDVTIDGFNEVVQTVQGMKNNFPSRNISSRWSLSTAWGSKQCCTKNP